MRPAEGTPASPSDSHQDGRQTEAYPLFPPVWRAPQSTLQAQVTAYLPRSYTLPTQCSLLWGSCAFCDTLAPLLPLNGKFLLRQLALSLGGAFTRQLEAGTDLLSLSRPLRK